MNRKPSFSFYLDAIALGIILLLLAFCVNLLLTRIQQGQIPR